MKLILTCSLLLFCAKTSAESGQWSLEKANDWHKNLGYWPVGPNFIPSTAENQLEFWQADTFDLVTIKRELGWVHSLGMNSMRVFLHYLPYVEDSKGYLQRIDTFLQIADSFNIKTMFVLFDDCWDPNPKPGKQPPVIEHKILSRWVQCPGNAGKLNMSLQDNELKDYVTGVITHFKDDKRVFLWDVYNEAGNDNWETPYPELKNNTACTAILLAKVFKWARQVAPAQPLTSPIFKFLSVTSDKSGSLKVLEDIIFANSDIISFHSYDPLVTFARKHRQLMKHGRPVFCSEYMARPRLSYFETIMPYAKKHNLGVINWGFVAGKTQEIYPWASWIVPRHREPLIWFHDILRADGNPYCQKEVNFIKKITRS